MTTRRTIPDFNLPIVDANRLQTQEFNDWVADVTRNILLTGSGTPETFVEAVVGQSYMDTEGSSGSIMYVKRDAAISGDSKQGWILV